MNLELFLEQQNLGSFIDGSFTTGPHSEFSEFRSPLLEKPWKFVHSGNEQLTNKAIASAEQAFTKWKQIPAPLRAAYLRKIGDTIIANRDIFAYVMAMEMGKPIKEGAREVDYSAGYFYWFAGEAERIYGKIIPSQFENKQLVIFHDPIGVCGIITPWNFPLAMAARKIAAALAAGCTVVCKPSQESPISMLAFAEMCREIGLPKGVVNVICGPEVEIGKALLQSAIVRKLSFTGSTDVGKYLYEQSAPTLKKLTLELGGHAPFIVCEDADLGSAAQGLISAKFRNNGQTCISANRIFVQENISQPFIEKLLEGIKRLKYGNPLDPDTDVSTVLHPASQRKCQEQVQDATKKGASLVLSAKNISDPVILTNVKADMHIYREETFGPIIPIITFKTIPEAIQMANDTIYGLAAYAYTTKLSSAHHLMQGLEYGIIGINDGAPSTPQASFGGVKQSGFGREGGPTGIYEYLQEKYVSLGV